MDPLHTSLATGHARLDVVPGIGGGIARFAVGGIDILRPAPPHAVTAGDVRELACYPLVPYSNRIANARLAVDGQLHELARNFGQHPHAIHGVGWHRPWQVVSHGAHRLLIALSHAPTGEGAAAWPFAFRAFQAFELAEASDAVALTMTLGIASDDPRPFPFGLGFHPFFPKRAQTRLAFRATRVWRTDATRIPTELVAIPEAWQFGLAREIGETSLDNVFAGWDGVATIEWPDARCRATIEADRALSHLVVYVPAHAGHFAVEPVTHMTDAFNRAQAGRQDTGARTLRPGATFSCTMRVIVDRSP